MPKGNYIVIPEVSSETRKYVPIGFMTPDVMCSNLVKIMPGATLYHFGILTSSMHMTWMRYVCGRMKSDYRYSSGIVYNNYPWPNVTIDSIKIIEERAKAVLDARGMYPNSSLADLYDVRTMPIELIKAHDMLNEAVEKAYCEKGLSTDEERISVLFKAYEEATKNVS